MEDGFHLAESYKPAYRARLNANLAFWDGLDGKTDWPTDADGDHPLTEPRARRLPGRRRQPSRTANRARSSRSSAQRARRAQHATCGGRALNDDVMDTLLHAPRQRAATARRSATASTAASRPGIADVPVPRSRRTRIRPSSPSTTSHGPRSRRSRARLELDDIQSGALHERPSPYVGTLPPAPDRRPRRRTRARPPAAPASSTRAADRRSGARRLDRRSPSPTTG